VCGSTGLTLGRFERLFGFGGGLARGGGTEKRTAERRKGYVHGGEKTMRDAKNRRRRV
jgi:hypothetical protein